MRKTLHFKNLRSFLVLTAFLFLSLSGSGQTTAIVPQLYLPAQNAPAGNAGWTITAATNNAATDYWKMITLTTNSMTSPAMNFSLYSNVSVSLSLQSFGTIVTNSDKIKVEYYNGSTWTQIGALLATTSTKGTQTVVMPATAVYSAAQIRVTAPNATGTAGARVYSVDIKGTTQATAITSGAITPTSIAAISCSNGSGAKRAMFISASSSGSALPVNSTTYTANTVFGSGTQIGATGWYCVFNNTGTPSVTVTGLSASSTYRVMVCEFDGAALSEVYNTYASGTGNPVNFTTAGPTPTITGAATAAAFTTIYGTVSTAQSFAVSGSNLTANLVATAPTGFEVSSDNITFGSTATYTQTAGSASGTLYIRLKAAAAVTGSYNSQNIVLSSTGATSVNITTSASGNSVTAKGLTITGLSGVNKIYNGTTAAASSGTAAYSGLVNGESFSVTGTPSLSFATAGVGTGIAITVIGYTAPSTNYTLTQPTGLTADITAKALTITGLTADNKVFDNTTTATLSGTATLFGVVAGDSGNVTVAGPYVANFSQSAVGTGLAVTVSGYTISGPASGNYTVMQPTGLTADITSFATPVITSALTASATYGVASASYFITATNTPTSYSASGLPAGLSLDTSTGEITGTPTANVGTYSVTISAINGGGSGSATLVYTITAKVLTLAGATANSKIYDRTTAATVVGTLTGVVGADVVTYSGTGTFASANVGTGIVVTSTSTLGGANAGNYTLTQPTGLSADITVKTLTVTGATASNKTYNGLTTAAITGATLVGVIAPDAVTVSGGGTFASANVGTGIVVTPSLVLGGANSGNYLLTQPTGLTANITAAALTITGLTGVNKVYDATTAASVTGTAAYSGLQNGETYTVTGTPVYVFATKVVGTAKAITVSGYTAPTSNYTAAQPTGISANITTATLTVTGATANNKVYDGTTAATLSGGSLSGVLLSDVVTLGSGTGTFSQSNVGTALTVTVSYTKSGADAGNYTLTQPTGTADITKANQTIVFGALAPKTTTDADYSPGATSTTSGTNPITYVSSNTAVATIVGGNIHITGIGTTTITASQAGSGNYNAASDVAQSLSVTQGSVSLGQYQFASNLIVSTPNANLTYADVSPNTVTGTTTSGYYNLSVSGGWGTTVNTNNYIQFTVTPVSGQLLTSTSLTFMQLGTAAGATNFVVRSSADGYTSNLGSGIYATTIGSGAPTVGATVSLSGTSFTDVMSATTFRIYPYGGSSTGNWRLDNLTLNGYITACSGTLASISTQPATQSLCTGSAINLSVSASGATAYQWRKNGVNISGATSSAYSIASATSADAASYDVVITGSTACAITTSAAAVVSVNEAPTAVTISPTSATICSGAIQPLTATSTYIGSGSVGTGTATTSAAVSTIGLGPNPFQNFYGGAKQQMLVQAATLSSMGLSAGSVISALQLQLAVADNTYGLSNLKVKLQNTAATSVSTTAMVATGWTTVYSGGSPYFPTSGYNNIPFSTNFTWDGTSNLLIGINYTNNNTGATTPTNTAYYSTTAFVSTAYYRIDNVDSATIDNYAGAPSFTYSTRNNLKFSFTKPSAITWTPNTDLYTDAAATTLYSGGSSSTVYAKPSASVTYSATATANSCTSSNTVSLTVNPLPTATISGTATVCYNASAPNITFTGASGTAPYTFTYNINGGSNQTVTTTAGNSVTVSVPTGTSGAFAYNLVSIAGQFCSQAQTGSATVTVKTPAGITSVTAASNPVCSGATTTLTANGITGDNASVTWWTGTGGTGTNLETGSTFVAGAGTYYAYVTADCGSSAEASITVTNVTNSWTGAISTSWNDIGNWSCGSIPTLSTVVLIPAVTNQPVIATSASAYNLTINAGATLSVSSGNNLTVTDAIVNAGTMTIENNANLIQINDVANTGAITVKRNSALQVRLDHTLWSSPVANQNLFAFSPQTLTNRFYVYNTATNTYVTTGLSAASIFTPAKGFAVRAPNNYTTTPQVWLGIFSGVPNNGATSYTLETSGTGYNLVGNPYPSAINGTTFVNATNNPAINGTLYFYAHTLTMNASGQFPAGTNYALWNSGSGGTSATLGTSGVPANVPNGIIHAGQGFLVKATSSGTANFTNAMRVGDNANQFFKTNMTTAAPLERHRLWFNLTDATGSTFNQIMIAYAEGATEAVDRDYDGLAYGNNGSALSSKIGGQDFTIQGRSLPFNSADVVSLGFKAATAGNYTITLAMMDGLFLDAQEVFIRDLTTGLVHNIKTAPYTFYSDAGTFDARFEVVYSNTLTVSNNTFDKASVIVYKNQGVFHVNTKAITMKEIVVFDIHGRMIFKQSGINSNTAILSGLNTSTAALLFKIVSENEETVTVKVIN
ncbi:YDG domain-containing protein [Flavobacterium sp. GT3R68]|uniref:YDG domain-containing protein n=1 Tax=Flavobacterium sp. GT3R68 TaxID=2594437 RepID=UPI000F85F9AC|nr:YDG domain-containing protein [Flavobacterium sp. GT3R68]RTY93907.1 hypothetical protein EKL32_13565 [Flavobacterium sp. GSN2]TRW93478.1 hypothetical protein FNW07_00820 [Flavobacterium sp. GT3R68]